MKTYTIIDAPLTVKVKDEKELIEKMKETTPFFYKQSITEFMAGVAERTGIIQGVAIDTSSHKAFVESSIKAGLIKRGGISLSKKRRK